MNRTIALFVGLAVLLAHTLTIHDTVFDDFAPPYELAHVAYRLARNVVYGDGLQWSPGEAGFDAYPSPLWVAISAVGQRLYLGVSIFSQTVGILCALSTAVVLSWFRRERAAGLIAPLLLVVNGGQAAAAASGTESALFALAAIFSFLALENQWRVRFAISLVVLCATRPEGVVFVAGFGLLSLFRKRDESFIARMLPFVPCAAWLVLIALLRYSKSDLFLSPTGLDLLAVSSERSADGLKFVALFAFGQVTPLLVIVPLLALPFGKLPPIGGRALFLGGLWTALVIVQGGRSLPFAQLMLPALPFFFLAIQAAMFKALDRTGWKRQLALASLAGATLLSGLASRTPSDLGPVPLKNLYERWFGSGVPAKYQSRGLVGRIGLAEEIRDTRRLRNVALFLRDHLEPADTVLTPWPGSAGYLSRLQIVDLLGRTHLWPGQDHLGPWVGIPRIDLATALGTKPDYIVYTRAATSNPPTPRSLAGSWIEQFDLKKDEPGRHEEIEALFDQYEAVAVPVGGVTPRGASTPQYYYLLRRKTLQRESELNARLAEDRLIVEVRHDSHQQICDLRVSLEDTTGKRWPVDPHGIAKTNYEPVTRSSIELYSSDRKFRLVDFVIPEPPELDRNAKAVRLHIQLTNPGTDARHPFGSASTEVTLDLF